MTMAVIDTNVLLVANQQHADVSPECVETCVARLQAIQKTGVVVVDDGYRILGEYRNKTRLNPPKGVGDVFLKWLLRNAGNANLVQTVEIHETADNEYAEFPVPALQSEFDPPDRKFVAVAHAHPNRPPVWQAADSKWLNWWPALRKHAITVEFLCPDDARRFYAKKFPDTPMPALPDAS